MEIRPARSGDAPGIAEVHVRSWQVAYRGLIPDAYLDSLSVHEGVERWTDLLSEQKGLTRVVLVVEEGTGIVGFASVAPSRDGDDGPDVGELAAIYLLADRWDRGWGRALLERAVQTLRDAGYVEATLWVLASNLRARRFYEADGWAADGTTKLEDRGGSALDHIRYRRRLT